MKLIATLLITSFTVATSWGQFGLRVGATSHISQAAEQTYTDIGPELALHYWLRLKNHRIEFYPEIIYSSYQKSDFRFVRDFTFRFDRLSFGVPVRVYPFDLASDCDCPTFSKQNDLFQKGFFLFVEPLLQLSKNSDFAYRAEDWPGDPDIVGQWGTTVGFGIGAGLDIGVSDLITLTPNLQYRPNLVDDDQALTNTTGELNFSVTATFRPDY